MPMRKDYARFVELSNKGARELGYPDTGAMWRGKYDMPAEAFAKDLDRLWDQLRPLYLSLHTYVRSTLHEKYGAIVPEDGPIPAHLLGNLWQQDWSNIYDLVAPSGETPVFSLDDNLKAKKIEPLDMVRIGERFFTSLGFDPLPKTFWERSLFVKPRDREVVCHASAWDIDSADDCASRCASTSTPRTSSRSITSSATTSTSAPTTRCRAFCATARTTASTRRSATRSRCRSRRNTSSRSGCSTRRRTRPPTRACC